SAVCPRVLVTDPRTTHSDTLSLHDALPISGGGDRGRRESVPRAPPARSPPRPTRRRARAPESRRRIRCARPASPRRRGAACSGRSEEHTSELQSRENLVCRLLLEKKKKTQH